MIITILLTLIAIATFFQSNKRFAVAFVYMFFTIIFDISTHNVYGFSFYFGAAFFDAIIATIIYKIDSEDDLSISLITISFMSLFCNFTGWINQGFPQYHYMSILLYTIAIISMLKRTRFDVIRFLYKIIGIFSSRALHTDNS